MAGLIKAECLYSDEDIVGSVARDRVRIIAIDAPLTNPPRMRMVDRLAISRGFKVFPPNFSFMRDLTARAWNLSMELQKHSATVIETHPRSALKSSGVRDIASLLSLIGVGVDSSIDMDLLSRNKDLADAVVCSVVAYCYYLSSCIDKLEADDGSIYLIRL